MPCFSKTASVLKSHAPNSRCARDWRLLTIAFLFLALSACQVRGTRPIIKIGLSAPFSGFDESVGYSVIGAVRMAIRERNQGGGVAGYSVELVALDDGNEPAMAAQRAREMIIDPAVMAVLGGFDDNAALAAVEEYRQAGMPFITLATSDRLSSQPGTGPIFRLLARQSDAGRRAGEFASGTLHARRIAIVSDAESDQGLGDGFASAALAGGAAIVMRVQIERWQLDFAETMRQVAVASPDAIFFAGRAAEAGEFLKQARAAGIAATFLGGPGVDDVRLVQIAGPAAQAVYYTSLGFALSQVADADLRERLSKAGLRPAGAYTVLAYDGTNIMLDALARAIKVNGKPTRQAVVQALRTTRYAGASGEISFDDRGNRQQSPLEIYTDTYR